MLNAIYTIPSMLQNQHLFNLKQFIKKFLTM